MKNFLPFFILGFLFIETASAQAPQFIAWQGVIRDTAWNPLPNQHVSFRFTVHSGSSTGTTVYSETQSDTTDKLGLVNLQIGAGTVVTGAFNTINWSGGSQFLQVELDPSGGSSYTTMGSPQMMSVPFALYAASAAMAKSTPAAVGSWQNDSTFKANNNLSFLHDSTTLTVLDSTNHGQVVSNQLKLVATDGKTASINMATGAAANAAYTFPNGHGAAGSVLTDTAGNGKLSWGSGGAVKLLGILTGANLNLGTSASFTISGVSGSFSVGDPVSDSQGNGGTVASVSGTSLTISTPSGVFPNGDTLYDNYSAIAYDSLASTFMAGEWFNDYTSGAYGIIVTDDGSANMAIDLYYGTVLPGDLIVGDNSGTSVVVTHTPPAIAVVSAASYSGDQVVTLSGGTAFILTDILLTNGSASLVGLGSSFCTGPDRSGYNIGTAYGTGTLPNTPNIVLRAIGILGGTTICQVVGNSLYFSIQTPPASTATADIYIYGYILH
jgi:hypothetical protein